MKPALLGFTEDQEVFRRVHLACASTVRFLVSLKFLPRPDVSDPVLLELSVELIAFPLSLSLFFLQILMCFPYTRLLFLRGKQRGRVLRFQSGEREIEASNKLRQTRFSLCHRVHPGLSRTALAFTFKKSETGSLEEFSSIVWLLLRLLFPLTSFSTVTLAADKKTLPFSATPLASPRTNRPSSPARSPPSPTRPRVAFQKMHSVALLLPALSLLASAQAWSPFSSSSSAEEAVVAPIVKRANPDLGIQVSGEEEREQAKLNLTSSL